MNETIGQAALLASLEQTQKEFWNIPRVTGMFLHALARGAERILEIGTSNGYSGIWLASAGAKLTTIEFWDKRLDLAKENFAKCGLEVNTLQGDALEVLRGLDEVYDLIFIDANKTQYLDYFLAVQPLTRKGTIIACDNILSHEGKCKPFIDAINAHPDYENIILPLPGGLSLATRLAI
jgi:predicted O-methyltransferase YrrM